MLKIIKTENFLEFRSPVSHSVVAHLDMFKNFCHFSSREASMFNPCPKCDKMGRAENFYSRIHTVTNKTCSRKID